MPGSDKVAKDRRWKVDAMPTISAELQTYLETRMDVFQEKVKANLLVSAKTGEILATTQRPTFNDTKAGARISRIL